MSNYKKFLKSSAAICGLAMISMIVAPLAEAGPKDGRSKSDAFKNFGGKSDVSSPRPNRAMGNSITSPVASAMRQASRNSAARPSRNFNTQVSRPNISRPAVDANRMRNLSEGTRSSNRAFTNSNNSNPFTRTLNRTTTRVNRDIGNGYAANQRPNRTIINNYNYRDNYRDRYRNNYRNHYSRRYNNNGFIPGMVTGAFLYSALNSPSYYNSYYGGYGSYYGGGSSISLSYNYGYPYGYSYPYYYGYGPRYGWASSYYYRPRTRVVYVERPVQTVVQQVPVYTQEPQQQVYSGPQQQSDQFANESCLQVREYTTTIQIGGKDVPAYGNACLMPDGSWKFGDPVAEPSF